MSVDASVILEGLIGAAGAKIWASELAFYSGHRRIDFWTLEPTQSAGFRATAYEIKVSRADFCRDSEEKQAPALLYSDRFWYVTPPGLINPAELPLWAGLQEFDGSIFSVKRRAPRRQKIDPDWQFIVNLMRNSGDCRRDVEIIKSQAAFYKFQSERMERHQKAAQKREFDRWVRRSNSAQATTATAKQTIEHNGE